MIFVVVVVVYQKRYERRPMNEKQIPKTKTRRFTLLVSDKRRQREREREREKVR